MIDRLRSAHWQVPYRWSTVALYCTAVVVFSDMYLTQPILPLLSHEFAVSPSTAGLSVSVVVLLIALASTSCGPLSDAVGRKVVMVGSCSMLALPTLLCAFAPSFSALLVFRALQGLCIPGVTAVAVAYLGDMVEPAALGRAVGGWIAANVAGGLTGRVASGLIADLLGWRAVFGCFGVLTLLCALLMMVALPRDEAGSQGGWLPAYRGMFEHLRDRRLYGTFLIGVVTPSGPTTGSTSRVTPVLRVSKPVGVVGVTGKAPVVAPVRPPVR